MFFIILTVALLCGAITYKKITLSERNAKMTRQVEELEARKDALENDRKKIEEYETYIKTPKYIEDTARNKLGLVYPNEVIFEASQD